MEAVSVLRPTTGVQTACQVLGMPRATWYRQQTAPVKANAATETGTDDAIPCVRAPHPRALSQGERQSVLEILHSDRFMDTAPAEVYATLLDEGRFLASERTMYRILAQAGENGDRRNQRVHPAYQKPELLATAPNHVWSWDITKLKGPEKGNFFSLYVLLDIYSRYPLAGCLPTGSRHRSPNA